MLNRFTKAVSGGIATGGITWSQTSGDAVALGCVQRDLLRRAVKIAGRPIPALAFPLIVVHPDHVSVGRA